MIVSQGDGDIGVFDADVERDPKYTPRWFYDKNMLTRGYSVDCAERLVHNKRHGSCCDRAQTTNAQGGD